MASVLTSRAAIVRQVKGPFAIEQIEVAAPRGTEVRVRVRAVGMCHTDLVVRDGFPVPMPIVLGHEGAGVVEAVGPEVRSLRKGDHVVLSFASCGACPNCNDARPAYCHHFTAKNFGGVRVEDGTSPLTQAGTTIHGNFFGQSSFSEYAIADERNAIKVDADLPLELLGPLGCGVQTGAGTAMHSLGLKRAQSVAIFGGGAVGLSALLGARAIGAGTVIVVEPNPARGALALELGASHVIDPTATTDVLGAVRELGDGGVNHAIDTTGIPAVIGIAVETLLAGGTLGLVGVPPADATMPANLMSMLLRGVTIKYITEGGADPQKFIPQMLTLHRAGKFPFDKLISTFPFASINEAANASESGAVIKPVLTF